ncbi:MAG: matrixin family metalloprotease, partial [Gemmatimonadales bacterium]
SPETATPPPGGAAAVGGGGGPSYTEQLGRADTRRRVRAGANMTYLNEMIAAADDSMLRRWNEREYPPVRVHLTRGTVPHFQPGFPDAVRAAFRRWEEIGLPVRFTLDADSAAAEVVVAWRERFDMDRTGQTDLRWDANGHFLSGIVSIATVDPNGRNMSADDVRVVTLHEVGHLIGLDHSPDSNDIMFPIARVRSLSLRDIETARLLYQLPPGSLR